MALYQDTKEQVRFALRANGYGIEVGEIISAKLDGQNLAGGEVHQVVWFDTNEENLFVSKIVIDRNGKGEFC